MKKIMFFIIFLSSFFELFGQTAEYNSLRLSFKKLKNGLSFIYVYNPDVSSSSFYLGFKAGSRYDVNGFDGESKLLEKIVLRGTAKLGAKNIAEEYRLIGELEKIDEEILKKQGKGEEQKKETDELIKKALLVRNKIKELGTPNAFEEVLYSLGAKNYSVRSTPDFFEIEATFPKDSLESFFVLQRDCLIEPAFRNFYDERYNVQLEQTEIKENQGNKEESFLKKFFEINNGGSDKEIKNVTLKMFREYFKAALNPKQAVLVISGNYEEADIYNMAEKYLGAIISDVEKSLELPKLKETNTCQFSVSEKNIEIAFLKKDISAQTEASLDLISEYLALGKKSSNFFVWSEAVNNGRVLNGFPGLLAPCLFYIGLDLKDGADPEAELKKTKDFFKNIKNMASDKALFEKGRKNLLFSFYSSSSKNSDLIRHIGEGYLISEDPYYYLKYINHLKEMSFDLVKETASTIFTERKD